MPRNLRLYIFGVTLLLFISVLTFTPPATESKSKVFKDAAVAKRGREPSGALKSKPKARTSALESKAAPSLPDLGMPDPRLSSVGSGAEVNGEDENGDADLPSKKFLGRIDKEEYLRLRDEYIGRLRGIEPGRPFNPNWREGAIEQMQRQREQMVETAKKSLKPNALTAAWTE